MEPSTTSTVFNIFNQRSTKTTEQSYLNICGLTTPIVSSNYYIFTVLGKKSTLIGKQTSIIVGHD